ncbi:MAG: beta-ketoacyl synthase N-terminal-like domain-containing protein [Verrucomicrobiales bacterium]|nr:beta-ketoacyl synthase N-terminal-like domain-containing protein [Verrucomicrobiales bacterium]
MASAIGGDSRSKPAIRNKNQSAQKEIAVIGMAGRFPGAPDLNTYWQNLVNEVETIDTFTPAELEKFGVSSADYMNPDYVPRGISLQGAYDFDAGFFDISGAEAEIMDPQVRLFLKTVWETLEDAGYPEEPEDNQIGIFAGGGYSTYQFAHLGLQSVERLSTLTGNASDYIATRCAYAFGLTGPAMSVQTACSTSLVAINEACEALRSGRCEMAVAGGVSFSYPHEQGYTYEEGLIYSKDGHCRPFDAKASGTIFSQGAGAVLLKPLEQALQDGDTIHAVIRGVATNNDGNRKGSFAAPSIEGQQQVIEAALADAGISPDEISYVEAHGTGTVIGDPIEVAGLTGAWRNYTNQTGFCPIGSVKSNIGHADAAAGIAGFLKLLLCLKNKTIPATLHYTVENAEMDLGNSPFFVQSKTTKWDSKKRIGSVNAMGLGGTNAHTIVEEAPPQSAPSQASPNYYIFPFSAKSPTSLKAILRKWQEAEFEPDSLNNAAFTLQHGRKEFPFRHAVVAEDFGDLQRSLANPDIQASHELRINRKPVFMFTGQGAQYRKMCYSSYRTDDAFRHAVDQCCRILKDQCDYDLQSILFAESGDAINETRHAQPALFTICYAQAKRWIDWGFQPESLIGHSIGEYVAAHLSGVMSLEDALKTVYTRGTLMQQMEAGDMLAVMDSAETVESLIDDIPNVEVAALNSPFLTAVAGKKEQITEAAGIFSEMGIRHKNLSTSHAFHSKMMEPMLEEFKLAVNQISLNPPSIPYISNLTGKWISDSEATNPDYYAEQLRSSVRFHDGINTITDGESPHLFLEMGPGRTLTTFASDILAGSDNAILPTLPGPKEGIDSERYTWQALANTWTAGQTLDWSKIMSTEGCRRIPLPTYQFDEKTYRIEPNITTTESKHENLSLFNTPVWKESKSGYAGVPITPGEKTVWLCFISPRSNLDKRILDAAKVTTARKIEIAKGGTFKRYSANRYRINPANEEDYEKLIKQVLNDFGTIGGVIHTWSYHRPKVTKVDHLWNSQATRSLSALWLGRALGGIGNRTPIPVNFVTRGLIKGKGCDLYPANYALSGVVGVIQREYPNLITRTIDLGDRIFDIRTEESLYKVLNGDRHHLRLAMKDGSWWLPTFENDDPDLYRSVEPYREIKEGGIYVITGGLGGLARTIAKDLSTRAGKLTFILITRSSFPERKNWQSMLTSEATDARTRQKILTLLDLEQNGCRAQIVSADLGIPGVMEDTLHAIQRQHERIDGVIHTSGVLRDGAVAMKEKRDVEEVFAAKSIPAQGLYNYFRSPDHNPDFVILFSSVSTDLAAFGQSDYAAANAYLDGIAEKAWSEGHPFFSIAWPAWRDVGMAADTKTENAGASGLSDEIAHNSISPETGAKAFFDIMSCSDSPRTVVSVLHFGNHYQNLLENRQPAANRSDETRSKIEAPVEQMLSLWKRELNNNDITEDDDYFELGGDSLLAVRLLQRIKETFDQAIPMSLLIKAPTARKLIRAMGLDSAEIEQIPGKDLSPHIVPLRIDKGSKETPIFCIHAADGGVMFYQGFASRLEKDRSIYGIESRVFHDDSYQLEADIEAVAAHYLKDIREFRPEGPYIFAGYSFGALVALRMAQLAREQGDTVEGLIIYDMFNPEMVRKYSIFERTKVIWDRRSILPFWPRVQSCLGRFGELAKWVCIHKWEYYKYKANKLEEEYSRHVRARYMYESLIPGFCPSEYNGRTLLVVTEDPGDRCDFGEIQGWRNVLKEKMTHRFVTGNHLEIFTGTHLELLVNHTDYFLRGGPQTTYDSHNVVEKEPARSDTRFVTKEKDQREFAG